MDSGLFRRGIKDQVVKAISAGILDGYRITPDDASLLMKKAETGVLAVLARESRNLREVEFLKKNVYHIGLSKHCIYNCPACIYGESTESSDLPDYNDIFAGIKGIDELHELQLSSGINKEISLDYFSGLIKTIKQNYPDINIRALRAIHVLRLAERGQISPSEVVSVLKSAGLDSFFGGDALISREEIRNKMQEYNFNMQEWLETQKVIHSLGLTSDAVMVYGHFESLQDRISHLEAIRDLQDDTKNFESFTPVKFRISDRQDHFSATTVAIEDMRVYALSRIFLDNIPDINVQSVVGAEGWEQVFDFGGNYVPVFQPGSDKFIPQYGEVFVPVKN